MAQPQDADADYSDWFTDHSDMMWQLFGECWQEEPQDRIGMVKVLEMLKEELGKPDLAPNIVEMRKGGWTMLSNLEASTQLNVEIDKVISTGFHEIHTIAISPDERYVAMTGITNHSAVQIMEWPDWREVKAIPSSSDCVAFTPDSGALIIGEIRDMRVFRFKDRQLSSSLSIGHTGNISKIAFSKDGSLTATVGWTDKTVRIWRSADVLKSIGSSKPAPLTPVIIINTEVQIGPFSFSPDGRHVLGGTYNGYRLWKLPESGTGAVTLLKQVVREPSSFRGYCTPALFTSDSKGGIVATIDGQAEFWTWDNLRGGKNNSAKSMQVSYVPVAQNYAGDSVLTQSEWFMSLIGCTAHFWHSSTLKEGVNVAALSLISGRHQTAVIAALSPKTKFLLTARGQLDTDLQICEDIPYGVDQIANWSFQGGCSPKLSTSHSRVK